MSIVTGLSNLQVITFGDEKSPTNEICFYLLVGLDPFHLRNCPNCKTSEERTRSTGVECSSTCQ